MVAETPSWTTWPKQEDIVLAEALVPLVNEWTRTLLEQKAGQMVDPWPSLCYLYFEGFAGGGGGEVAKKSQHIDMFEIKKRGFEIDGFISLSDK